MSELISTLLALFIGIIAALRGWELFRAWVES